MAFGRLTQMKQQVSEFFEPQQWISACRAPVRPTSPGDPFNCAFDIHWAVFNPSPLHSKKGKRWSHAAGEATAASDRAMSRGFT
jgi:hypothetical protein